MEDQDTPLSHIRTAADAAATFTPFFTDAEVEKILILHLDSEERLLGIFEYPGTGVDAELPVREIFSEALRLCTSRLIIGHNHPSGDPQPSEADCEGTRMLAETGRRLGIDVADHLIFGAGGEAVSLRALGLL